MDKREKRFSAPTKCRHCGNTAPMEIVADFNQTHDQLDDTGQVVWEWSNIFELLLCPACFKVTMQSGCWHEGMEGYEWNPQVLYPTEAKPIQGLPTQVNKAYDAALKVRFIDPNAFAMLLGRLLEIICQDRKAEGHSLYEKIKFLANKGEIPTRLAEMANGLRQLRNIGAHPDLGELSQNEIPFLDDLCRAILEYVYSAPELLERVQERLNTIKKA